jgi:hypothetical protein
MINEILDRLIGTYTYQISKFADGSPVCGISGLDYRYIFSFIILLVSLVMVYALLNKLIVRMFGVLK